jgi:hypothetical protein
MAFGETRFRTSFTYRAGNVPAEMIQGKIVNINLVNWTVDVAAQFDRKRYFDIQVGSPYMHYSNGEGMSVFPEVGAKCMVCLPSDSSPPYVSSFVMPVEIVDAATPDAPKGTTSKSAQNATSSGASFAGGRPAAKPGDIWMRTRDDNFVILHRGGVVQIGCSELAQRLYIPLNHLIMDVSQNYAHHNPGGSILWSLQEGSGLDRLPTEYTHSFRVFADNAKADVRVKIGKVSDPIAESPDSAIGDQVDLDALSIGTSKTDFIVAEVVVAPEGFNPETGHPEPSDIRSKSVFRFFFDRAGGTFLRCKGSLAINTKKKLRVRSTEEMEFFAKRFFVKAEGGVVIDGGPDTHIKGGIVRLGPGNKSVAYQGCPVKVTIPFTPMPVPGPPGTVPLVLTGFISGGEATVRT